jgi:MFS family permease
MKDSMRRRCFPLPSRWAVLAGVIFIEACAGNPYAFSVFAPQLQKLFSWTEAQIAAVGGIGNIGIYLCLDAGFFFDSRGPRETALIGASLSLAGYGLLWAASTGSLGGTAGAPAPTVAVVSVAAYIFNHGAGWLDTAAVTTAVRAFPKDRGLIVGLLKAFFGLSASLLTLCYASFFKPNVVSFIFFLTALIPGVAAVASALMRAIPDDEASAILTVFERKKLTLSCLGVLLVASYVAAVGVLESRDLLSPQPLLAALLVPLLLVQILLTWPETKASLEETLEEGTEMNEPILGKNVEYVEKTTNAIVVKRSKGGASFLQSFLALDLWLFCFVFFAGTGAGLTLINNLGSLTKALGASADGQDVYVILLSVSNCLGRLLVGIFSDSFSKRLSRPWICLVCVVIMIGGQVTLAFADLNTLYLGVILTGFAYGSFWSIGPSLIADRFGVRCFASLYNVVSLWASAASYIFSSVMVSSFYASRSQPGSTDCDQGILCFQDSFLTIAGVNVLSALSCTLLAIRLKGLYDPTTGQVKSYADWKKLDPEGGASSLARWAVVVCQPLCCCSCGRALLEEEQEDDGSDLFEGDVSMNFLGEEEIDNE